MKLQVQSTFRRRVLDQRAPRRQRVLVREAANAVEWRASTADQIRIGRPSREQRQTDPNDKLVPSSTC